MAINEDMNMSRVDDSAESGLYKEGRYLIFSLNHEDYGIAIKSIREIIGMMPVRSIPQAPPFIKGVINLRDKVVPVIDLRAKFKLPAVDYHDRTCIIILELDGEGSDFWIGLVVDSVSEVLNIPNQNIDDTPYFGKNNNTDYILAMAKINDQIKILLNIEDMFQREEVRALGEIHSLVDHDEDGSVEVRV